MKAITVCLWILLFCIVVFPQEASTKAGKPIVIAHRGASGFLPEHTLASYSLAIWQGADYIEPDLVMTKDGHLIARHDNVLNLTTNVSFLPQFADRKTTKNIDGVSVTGWFSEDFTLAEIKQMRAIERIPQIRPANARLNEQFEIPTLEEILCLVKAMEKLVHRPIGIYPETKHPTHFARLGLKMEETLVRILSENGYKDAQAKVFIQSFEISNLKKLRKMTDLPLVQLLSDHGKPYDVEIEGGALTYDEMATPEGLKEIATYADGVGPEKYHFLISKDAEGNLDISRATSFVKNAHAVGLKVHPYTFRAENYFLPKNFQIGSNLSDYGNSIEEIRLFLSLGIDGFFIDHPNFGRIACDK